MLQWDLFLHRFPYFRIYAFQSEREPYESAAGKSGNHLVFHQIGPCAALERNVQSFPIDQVAYFQDMFLPQRHYVVHDVEVPGSERLHNLSHFIDDRARRSHPHIGCLQGFRGTENTFPRAAPHGLNGGKRQPTP